MKKALFNKRFILSALIIIGATSLYAQLNEQGATDIKNTVTTIGKTLYLVIYSIAALAGLVGGVTVSMAYWNDKQNAPELLKKFLMGFIILLLLGGIIHLFTGIKFGA